MNVKLDNGQGFGQCVQELVKCWSVVLGIYCCIFMPFHFVSFDLCFDLHTRSSTGWHACCLAHSERTGSSSLLHNIILMLESRSGGVHGGAAERFVEAITRIPPLAIGKNHLRSSLDDVSAYID